MQQPTKKHIIDPDKLAETLQINWRHWEGPSASEEGLGKAVDEGSFIFDLGENVSLGFAHYDPGEATLRQYHKSEFDNEIVFAGITKVAYLPKLKAVILESLHGENLSQIRIHSNGTFVLMAGASTKKRTSWAKLAEEDKLTK